MATTGSDWKTKVNTVLNSCQQELKRTTSIGKKMFSASRTNACMHESLEKLGALALKDMRDNKLAWDNPEVKDIVEQIEKCEVELHDIENEVTQIKKR